MNKRAKFYGKKTKWAKINLKKVWGQKEDFMSENPLQSLKFIKKFWKTLLGHLKSLGGPKIACVGRLMSRG
jgi:hypothetical protein